MIRPFARMFTAMTDGRGGPRLAASRAGPDGDGGGT